MKELVYISIVAILVAYSQLIVKWRVGQIDLSHIENASLLKKLIVFITDPFILSGYFVALISSFLWLYVVSKVSLSTGYPIYIGLTFVLVILGSWSLIGEALSVPKLIGITFILLGIIIGSRG